MPKRARHDELPSSGDRGEPSGSAQQQCCGRPRELLEKLAMEEGVTRVQVEIAAKLLDEGNTLPFIARYRKETTGSLDDEQLRRIASGIKALDNLEEQRSATIGKLEKLGALSCELRGQLQCAQTVRQIEDLYLPYRPKRSTKASAARDRGLGPLADLLLRGGRFSPETPPAQPEEAARELIKEGAAVSSVAEALAGAQDIIAELAAELAEGREAARGELRQRGMLLSMLSKSAKQAQQGQVVKKGGKKEGGGAKEKGGDKAGRGPAGFAGMPGGADTYSLYHNFKCPVRDVRPHQVQAITRGEGQGELSVGFSWNLSPVEALCTQLLLKQAGSVGQRSLAEPYQRLVQGGVQDGVKRLLKPAIEREIRGELGEAARQHAVRAFSRNLKDLLLQPPLPGVVVLGVDPAYRTGCKLAVCDATGKVLETGVAYPHPPATESERGKAEGVLKGLISRHGVQAVAIGNGTASRETQLWVAAAVKPAAGSCGGNDGRQVGWCVVSEAGASVYSACQLAGRELPSLDVSLRGAVSIARRLQDPLSELVKVPPESLGVGQYHHDLKSATLADELAGVVESAVNAVGVDLNAASPALLAHVAGLNKSTAAAIVARRDAEGPFETRQSLLGVKGVGPRTFQQCAGFLRVRGGGTLLDSTAVHPESYPAAETLIREGCGERHGEPAAAAVPAAAADQPPLKKRKQAGGAAAAAAAGTGGGSAGNGGARGGGGTRLDAAASPPLTPAMLLGARPALLALLGPSRHQAQRAQQRSSAEGNGEEEGRGVWLGVETFRQVAARLGVGTPTLEDVVESLLAPERDARGRAGLEALQFQQALGICDLSPGMELSGVVRNVVDFGAFVDINAGQEGLVHVSELRKAAQRAQQGGAHAEARRGEVQQGGGQRAQQGDAYSLAAVGDTVRVRVLGVDVQRGRISLGLVC